MRQNIREKIMKGMRRPVPLREKLPRLHYNYDGIQGFSLHTTATFLVFD